MKNFDKYIERVKEQLDCNASDEYKDEYIVYTYTEKQIDDHLDYFKKCFEDGLSAYKALLFFTFHLDELNI